MSRRPISDTEPITHCLFYAPFGLGDTDHVSSGGSAALHGNEPVLVFGRYDPPSPRELQLLARTDALNIRIVAVAAIDAFVRECSRTLPTAPHNERIRLVAALRDVGETILDVKAEGYPEP